MHVYVCVLRLLFIRGLRGIKFINGAWQSYDPLVVCSFDNGIMQHSWTAENRRVCNPFTPACTSRYLKCCCVHIVENISSNDKKFPMEKTGKYLDSNINPPRRITLDSRIESKNHRYSFSTSKQSVETSETRIESYAEIEMLPVFEIRVRTSLHSAGYEFTECERGGEEGKRQLRWVANRRYASMC